MRSASTSRPSRHVRSQVAAEPVTVSSSVERAPFAVPGAGGALVLLHHRGQQRRDQAGRLLRAAERGDRGHRVALVRHRGRAAAARPRAPRRPRSGEQGDVARGLADRARGDAERAGELADPAAQGVPGQHGRVEAAGSRASYAGFERAGRAAELDGQADAVQVVGGLVEASIQPAAFRPNVVGLACWSSVRPMIGVSRWASASCAAASAARAQVAEQRRQRALGDEHRRGVDGVLARRAVVHRRVGQRLAAPSPRPRGVADLRRSRADRLDVVVSASQHAPRSHRPRAS